jgi:phage shock protein E
MNTLCRLLAPGLVGVLALAGTPDDESPHTKDSLTTIRQRLDDEKAVLIDVREKNEWEAGHLAQAKLIPLTEIGKKIDEPEFLATLRKTLPADKPVYLHCKSGGRSVIAMKELQKALGGDYDFRPLKPGYQDLLDAGFKKAETK